MARQAARVAWLALACRPRRRVLVLGLALVYRSALELLAVLACALEGGAWEWRSAWQWR